MTLAYVKPIKGGYAHSNMQTLTSEMHFVKFHPEVASCLLSRGKRKYASLGMRLLWKYIRNYFLVYHFISHFLLYLKNYKEFEAEILDLQSEKYGLSFGILSVAVMSQVGILTPDWSIAAVPCYSPEWKIAFGVNDEANKIRVCSKITSWNNFLFENVINNDILQLCLQKISLY